MTANVESIATRKERRAVAARARRRGEPEITKQGVRHITGTCAGCYFWDTADPDVKPGMGICRKAPAALVTVGSPNGNVLQALWPVMSFFAACGEHLTPAEFAAKHAAERASWGL